MDLDRIAVALALTRFMLNLPYSSWMTTDFDFSQTGPKFRKEIPSRQTPCPIRLRNNRDTYPTQTSTLARVGLFFIIIVIIIIIITVLFKYQIHNIASM